MTSDFNPSSLLRHPQASPHCGISSAREQSFGDLDVTKRDRFELLSAYLDGEVTPDERRLVTTWLNQDESTKCLYTRLLNLRQGIQGLPVPATYQSADEAVVHVMQRLDCRFKTMAMATAGVISLILMGGLSGVFNHRTSLWELAFFESPPVNENALEVALDQPVIAIPKAPVSGNSP